MREIFPDKNYTSLAGENNNLATKDDLIPIVNQLNETKQALEVLESQFDEYKEGQETSINTSVLNAITAAISTINATLANLETAEVDNLTVNGLAQLTNLTTQIATITTSLTVPSATINNLSSLEITALVGNIGTLSADTAAIGEFAVENFAIQNATISNKTTTKDLEAETATIDGISAKTITADTKITTDELEADSATIDGIVSEEVTVENITWGGNVLLSDVESFFLEIPHFENGQYYLQLIDNSVPFATMEIFNSVDNYFVRWSQSTSGNIQKIYRYGSGTSAQLYIEFANESGNALTMKYGTSSATPNLPAPESYTTLPITPDVEYPVSYKDGSKFFKNVDLATSGSTVGVLRGLNSDDWEDAVDWQYELTDDVDAIIYKPDQSVNTDDDVDFHGVDATNINARNISTRNFKATELDTSSTIDLSGIDDGAIVILRDSSTAASLQNSTAYIKRTISDTPVLFKLLVGKDLPNSVSNKPLIWSPSDNALVEATDISITGDISANDISASGDITITGDATITGDISATNAELDTLDVAHDTVIHGDLWVDGTTHTTTEESISTSSDVVVLRQNNNTTLGATYAGMLINKYDGTHDLALVTDSDGTLRVGTGTGANTTYTNIYWDDDTSKWYSDSALTTEVSPVGTLTSWQSLEVLGDVKHYTNAVFTVINFTGLVPVLARDEDTNMTDQALMKWDATSYTAKTIPAPTADGQLLVNRVVSNSNTYAWESIPTNYVFATMADYTAVASSIPNGSTVVIQNEDTFIVGAAQ